MVDIRVNVSWNLNRKVFVRDVNQNSIASMNCYNLIVFWYDQTFCMTKKKSGILQLVHLREAFTLHNYLDLSGENVNNEM